MLIENPLKHSLIVAVALAALCAPLTSSAQFEGLVDAPDVQAEEAKKNKPKEGVSAILGVLDWGCGHHEVLAEIKADIDKRFQDELDQTTDVFEIDRIRKRKQMEYARVEKTYVKFGGQRTGYESSLIADDYQANSGEAVIRVDDAAAQRYYFFKDDRLWKVLVAYNNSVTRRVPFEKFAKQVRKKYGRPIDIDWYTPKGGTKTIRAATWNDDITQLVVEDRSAFFGSFVMTFLSKVEGVSIEAARPKRGTQQAQVADDPSVASALADITGGTLSDDSDVVDRITGETPEVDLTHGRKRYETISRVGPTPTKGATSKRGRRKGARKGKKPQKAVEKAPEEPFIIY